MVPEKRRYERETLAGWRPGSRLNGEKQLLDGEISSFPEDANPYFSLGYSA